MSKIIVWMSSGMVCGAYLLKNDLYPGDVPDGVVILDEDHDGADDSEVIRAEVNGEEVSAMGHEEELLLNNIPADIETLTLAILEPNTVYNTETKNLPLLISQLKTAEGKKALSERLGNGSKEKE